MSNRGGKRGGPANRGGDQPRPATRGAPAHGRGRGAGAAGPQQAPQPRPAAPAPSPTPSWRALSAGDAQGRGRGGGAPAPQQSYQPRPAAPSPSPTPALPSDPSRGVGAPAPAPQQAPQPRPAAPVTSNVASSSSGASSPAAVAQLGREIEEKLSIQRPDSGLAPPRRPGFGAVGQKCVIRANHFIVKVADCEYFHYDVAIAPEVASKGVCRLIVKELIKVYGESHLASRLPAYDGRKSLYTAGPLPFDSKEFPVSLPEKDKGSSSSKRKDREFKVTIKLAKRGDLYQLRQFLKGAPVETPQDAIQVLDVVLRGKPSERYTVVGRSFFHSTLGNPGDLGDGLQYWQGYYQSLRPTQLGLSLNIDLSARAFYDPVPVTDFVQKNFNCRDLLRPLSDQDRLKVKKALRGVKVAVTHGAISRSYKVSGISTQGANQTMFTLDDKQTDISVAHYFQEKYGIALKYPRLPCLQAGSNSKPVYIPMEICTIVSGQRYTKRLNEKQVTNLLRATCIRPTEREERIKAMVARNEFGKEDLVSKEFGMTVGLEPARVSARILPAPQLNYHPSGRESTVAPRMGQWNMIDKKMINGGTVATWACINFSTKLHRSVPYEFCHELISMCNSKGMSFNPQPVLDITFASPNQIEKALNDVNKEALAVLAPTPHKQLQLLIIILPDFTGSYGTIKRICETQLGLVSQCCQPRQAAKMQKQYCENVALKINVKVGGRNTVLNDAIRRNIPRLTDIPTIIFGADVTHPSSGDDTSPSIAAVVASMDWPEVTKYRCLISAQSHRDEIIDTLFKKVQTQQGGSEVERSLIIEHLKAFRRATGKKPARIIFYRDGVSEGQFSQVLLYEIDQIRKACQHIEPGYLPPITFVVVQKRHHTRFFADNKSMMDRSGNVLPGTVVDTGICHPSEFDFFLNSHAGIQGTSRPAHYHVLYDENNFTADGLQMLTNHLCYTYARCTRAVSIVPPAYYAHLAAFRARYYIESENSDANSSTSRGATGERAAAAVVREIPKIKDNVLDVMFYC